MGIFDAIHQKIVDAKSITIWGHALPDGDCYGCQLALREALRLNFPEKHVLALGSGIPELFDRLEEMDGADDDEIRDSLAVLVDVSCLQRVESRRVFLASEWVKFDHHMSNPIHEPFPYPIYVAIPGRIACAEILFDYFMDKGYRLNKLIAEALYLGIYTDSGGFVYPGTTEHTMEVVNRLLGYGVEPDSMLDIIRARSPEYLAFAAYLRNARIKDGQVSYLYVPKENYELRGLKYEIASSMVSELGKGVSTPIYCLFTEMPDGKEIRGEVRCVKAYNVQPTCAAFGGGGHKCAAGVSFHDPENDIPPFIAALNRLEPVYNDGD